MIYFHFTSHFHLRTILTEGLTKGEVPMSATHCLNAVWLTSDKSADGHGLSSGEEITLTPMQKRMFGIADDVPDTLKTENKRAVRISVKVPRGDRHIEPWLHFARRRLEPKWLDALHKTGGNKERTWFLYWGEIPPSWFLAVDHLAPPDDDDDDVVEIGAGQGGSA